RSHPQSSTLFTYTTLFRSTGYAGYEKYNHEQDNEIGAGVYMFDADNGELLWYASKTEASGSVEHTEHDDLQYSVVSEIKTVDRKDRKSTRLNSSHVKISYA